MSEMRSEHHNVKQNYPSHDPEYAPKNYLMPPPGTVLCATDFSFVELVNLAESCIQRFGHSTMGDVINAGVDPHRWFAGVREGYIDNDTSFITDPEKVAAMKAKLKELVTPDQRQHSKAANFLPEHDIGNIVMSSPFNCWDISKRQSAAKTLIIRVRFNDYRKCSIEEISI